MQRHEAGCHSVGTWKFSISVWKWRQSLPQEVQLGCSSRANSCTQKSESASLKRGSEQVAAAALT